MAFYIVDVVHWEAVTHPSGCFGQYSVPLVMPDPAGIVQSTRKQEVLPERLCSSTNISAHCLGDPEKVAGKGEGRAELWM